MLLQTLLSIVGLQTKRICAWTDAFTVLGSLTGLDEWVSRHVITTCQQLAIHLPTTCNSQKQPILCL